MAQANILPQKRLIPRTAPDTCSSVIPTKPAPRIYRHPPVALRSHSPVASELTGPPLHSPSPIREMTKVHPNSSTAAAEALAEESPRVESPFPGLGKASVLTVWRKSLIFHGNGFTVFDSKGNLVFRVDNYSGSRNEIVLMDAPGKPLLTIRRKRLSLGDHWLIYNAEEAANPQFAVKKHKSVLHSKALARVTPRANSSLPVYNVEGSYSRRRCAVYDKERRQLAEIKRKESAQGVALGLDVFSLVVEPGLDAAFAMAMVILLEQMFGSRA